MLNVLALTMQDLRKEANRLAREELGSLEAANHVPGQARMLLAIAEANSTGRGRANREKAMEAAVKAQGMFADVGDKMMDGRAHIAIANIQIAKGSTEEAVKTANLAKALLESVGDVRGMGVAQHCLAVALKGG